MHLLDFFLEDGWLLDRALGLMLEPGYFYLGMLQSFLELSVGAHYFWNIFLEELRKLWAVCFEDINFLLYFIEFLVKLNEDVWWAGAEAFKWFELIEQNILQIICDLIGQNYIDPSISSERKDCLQPCLSLQVDDLFVLQVDSDGL